MKRMLITMGKDTEDMVSLLTGTVGEDWESPDYIRIKVISEDDTEEVKLYHLSQAGSEMLKDPSYILKVITHMLIKLGIPANVKGFYYLRQAVNLKLLDISMVESITIRLYPTLAEMFNTEPLRVERTIRYAIETAWSRGQLEVVEELFGYTIRDNKGKPTNSEFIAMLADQIRVRYLI